MRLVTFTHAGSTRIGVQVDGQVVDLAAAAPELPREMCAFLAAGQRALDAARAATENGRARLGAGEVRIGAPILRPPKILAVGLNYADHVRETGREAPKVPMIFNKQSTAVTGSGAPVHVPRVSDKVDWEGELAFVIGRRCRHVPRDRAASVIAGYTIVNDVSVRDWQHRVPTFTMGKSFDTHCPLGPAIVTADEVGDPHALDLRTWVNDDLRQSSNTRELIFDCFYLVEHLSTAFTLEPGDVVSTGTPSGVGAAMNPPTFLKAGDTVRVVIDKLGELRNPVIAEPADTAQF
jgi:2-keto-4-pentenoate hydratase/2-oxohepta-3-ene-1,7-dioic acid hydratase in catechol pathway